MTIGRVLSLCDHTGAWSAPYRDAGAEVIQVDLSRGQDVRFLEHDGPIHGILASPPCCRFSRAGAHTWKNEDEDKLADALAVVDACLRAVAIYRPRWWALENPPGRLERWLGPPQFKFHPYYFGDPWTKLTYLWGHFAPPCELLGAPPPVVPVLGDITSRMSSRWKMERSRTPSGFAIAFALANPVDPDAAPHVPAVETAGRKRRRNGA